MRSALRGDGDALHFAVDGEAVMPEPGAAETARWRDRIVAPPKSLADRLGLSPAQPVSVSGEVDDDALEGATTSDRSAVWQALLHAPRDMDALLKHRTARGGLCRPRDQRRIGTLHGHRVSALTTARGSPAPQSTTMSASRRNASAYFAAVPSMTSRGRRGPGAVLFQSSVSR